MGCRHAVGSELVSFPPSDCRVLPEYNGGAGRSAEAAVKIVFSSARAVKNVGVCSFIIETVHSQGHK